MIPPPWGPRLADLTTLLALALVVGDLGGAVLHAQTRAPQVAIDLQTEAARVATQQDLSRVSTRDRALATAWARARGWRTRGVLPDGRVFELMKVVGGEPRYYVAGNANAAISTAASLVRDTAPYLVNGTGVTVGIWDGGHVRSTHQEFGSRVRVLDTGTVQWHATHVAGTVGAAGIDARAKGMAPAVGIDSYEWNDDLAEMASRAATGPGQADRIHLSNHSYGWVTGWDQGDWSGHVGYHFWGWPGELESRWFGQYTADAASWDALHAQAPYYLAFKAAGNDRNDTAPPAGTVFYYLDATHTTWLSKLYVPATDPLADGWDQGGYDTMDSVACAKNVLTVGAVSDAVSGSSRAPQNGLMATFSSWGPADDGRVKPDLVANGVALRSSYGDTDNDYASVSGTSMATPNAAGSAALLVEYFAQLFPGQAMRASTLKGLVLHTADDLGTAGPDYAFGWGLMNTEAAAAQIKAHAESVFSRRLYEGRLAVDRPSEVFVFSWDGSSPVRATLCWTDPPGPERTALDDRTPVLVNDLDLRINGPGGSPAYFPFVLDVLQPTAPATTGDNVVDNVEQIVISAPAAGAYTLIVTHKGALSGGEQRFSLILSGQAKPKPPTAVIIAEFRSVLRPAGSVALRWTTSVSADLVGFYLERLQADGAWSRVNPRMIPASGSFWPSEYAFEDTERSVVDPPRYRLVCVDFRGAEQVAAESLAEKELSFSARRLTEGLSLQIRGSPRGHVAVETCADLTRGSWRPLGTFVLDDAGTVAPLLPLPADRTAWFYRLRAE